MTKFRFGVNYCLKDIFESRGLFKFFPWTINLKYQREQPLIPLILILKKTINKGSSSSEWCASKQLKPEDRKRRGLELVGNRLCWLMISHPAIREFTGTRSTSCGSSWPSGGPVESPAGAEEERPAEESSALTPAAPGPSTLASPDPPEAGSHAPHWKREMLTVITEAKNASYSQVLWECTELKWITLWCWLWIWINGLGLRVLKSS